MLVIGLLVILYARYYLSEKDPMGRFFAYLLLFQGSMLGVVLSENLIQLLIFWELTSISSFLLISYWRHREDARQGARMALAITGSGGLAMLAGFLLAEGGASHRLLRVFRAWVGWIPGGTAVVCAAVCAFFTAFTGASGVTIIALGALLFPALQQAGYPEKFNLGLVTSAGSLGLLFAPSLPLILYGVSPRGTVALAQASRARAFLEGRGYVTPHDVKTVGMDVLRHRVITSYEAEAEGLGSVDVIQSVFDTVPVP